MLGTQIMRIPKRPWSVISLVTLVLSVVVGIGVGPWAVLLTSIAGGLFALAGFVSQYQRPQPMRVFAFPITMLMLHVGFFVAFTALQLLFLTPLPDESLDLPKFTQLYTDHDGLFELRGPKGWTYRPLVSAHQSGVRMQPHDRSDYMGVSETMVMVRKLDKAPPSKGNFLQKAAETFAENRKKDDALFQFAIEKTKLLDGSDGIVSTLEIKKFWVPIYQVSVFGIKNNRYLCSVSVTGLKAHSTLSKVVCLGLFETVKIK